MLAVQVPTEHIMTYQTRAEAFWQAETTALYRAQAGLVETLQLDKVYAEFADLFTLQQVRALVDMARSQADSHYRHVAEFAAMRYLRQTAVPYDEMLFRQLGEPTVPWDGTELPFFAIASLLAAEPDAARRKDLYLSRSQFMARQNDTLRKRWEAITAQAGALGFDTYYALCNEMRGLRLVSLQFMAQSFLKETADTYFQRLSWWSQTMLGTEKPDAADRFYMMRGAQFDTLFPPEKLALAVNNTASFLGLPLVNQTGLEIDLAARPQKSLRPFCAFIHVPDDIKLVVNPAGGYGDYRAVFHELGHALHGLHIPADLPFAVRYLGDDSVGEAFAFLFEQLPGNPIWLQELLGSANYETFVDYIQFMRLWLIRRCAVSVLYENLLHTGTPTPETLYASLLAEHLGLNVSPAYYLLDVEDGFYNAQYFRAWMLAAQIASQLEARIGEDWMVSAGTGAFLRPLWQKGQPAAEIIAILIGEEGLNPEALIRSFQV